MTNLYAIGDHVAQVNERIRRDQIDILIDLGGHTGNAQISIMAMCPAPIQVAALCILLTHSSIPELCSLIPLDRWTLLYPNVPTTHLSV